VIVDNKFFFIISNYREESDIVFVDILILFLSSLLNEEF